MDAHARHRVSWLHDRITRHDMELHYHAFWVLSANHLWLCLIMGCSHQIYTTVRRDWRPPSIVVHVRVSWQISQTTPFMDEACESFASKNRNVLEDSRFFRTVRSHPASQHATTLCACIDNILEECSALCMAVTSGRAGSLGSTNFEYTWSR